jgi:hypothetical protein
MFAGRSFKMISLTRKAFLCTIPMIALATPLVALGNGYSFFDLIYNRLFQKKEFTYIGTVKTDDGKYLDGATISVTISEPNLIYDTTTDSTGRYHTPDLGRAIMDLGYQVEPSKIHFSVEKEGYKLVRTMNLGRAGQHSGTVEMAFTMVPEADRRR